MHKRTLAIGAALAAALAIPLVATAHTPSVTVSCEIPSGGGPGVPTVRYAYSAFNPNLVATPTEVVTLDGVVQPPPFGPAYTFTGAGSHTRTLAPIYGVHTLAATSSVVQDGRSWPASASRSVNCGTAPPPPPPQPPPDKPVPQPPVEQPPPPPPTCAELIALYPGAGAARRASWGCPVVIPPTKPPIKVKRSVKIASIHACVREGQRPYILYRARVVWSRGGEVVKTKVTTFRRYGAVCRIEVTG